MIDHVKPIISATQVEWVGRVRFLVNFLSLLSLPSNLTPKHMQRKKLTKFLNMDFFANFQIVSFHEKMDYSKVYFYAFLRELHPRPCSFFQRVNYPLPPKLGPLWHFAPWTPPYLYVHLNIFGNYLFILYRMYPIQRCQLQSNYIDLSKLTR